MGNIRLACKTCIQEEEKKEIKVEEKEAKKRQQVKDVNKEMTLKSKARNIKSDCFIESKKRPSKMKIKEFVKEIVKEEERENDEETVYNKSNKVKINEGSSMSLQEKYERNRNINKEEKIKVNLIEDENLSSINNKIEENISIQTNFIIQSLENQKEKENILSSQKFELASQNNDKSLKFKRQKEGNYKENFENSNEKRMIISYKPIAFKSDKDKTVLISNKLIYILHSNGYSYVGNFNSSQSPNGYGKLTNTNEEFEYNGEFENYKISGYGEIVYKNNTHIRIYSNSQNIEYDAKNNSITLYTVRYNDNFIYEGVYINESNKSIGKYSFFNGDTYIGYILNNCLSGYGILYEKSGKVFAGEWKNSMLNGYSEILLDQNKKYIGYCKDDQKEGFGIFDWGNQKIYIGFWSKNKQNGIGRLITNSVSKYGLWSNGERLSWFKSEIDAVSQLREEQVCYLKLISKSLNDVVDMLDDINK